MGNLSYIESINKKQPSFSLYRWVKQNPKKHISEIYDNKMPSALFIRADRFKTWFGIYPGDGVLFFHDDLLNPLSEVFPSVAYYYNRPEEYYKLFNYLYSFASCFTVKSKGALAVFLLDCPSLAVPLYKYRKNFDPEAFTTLIGTISVYKSFNEYIKDIAAQCITKFIWEAILLQKVTLNVCDNKILMYLYHGYTYTAIQRFFLLSTSRFALKEHINNAYYIYKETCLLLNNWNEDISRLNFSGNRRIPQMSSIKAMERFHDLKAEEMLEEQRAFDIYQHTWDILSAAIKDVSPEWYLPEYTSDIRLRGQQHHNCVGGYIERHYKPVENDFKMLLLFTDFCEAEVHLFFREIIEDGKAFLGCINARIQQAKTAFNKNISEKDFSELKKVIKVFINMPFENFNPDIRNIEK
ncbi:MAG: hypothetical protein FWB86_04590 [Treponema sp.]|nr:hypothetical protein [Treponema sp.]MCL2251499.1 hypothetical protein [Treponema sp.]